MAFMLTITERNHSWAGRSPAITTHATKADAAAALIEYVRRNWDAEIGTEPPADEQDLIAEYFGEVLEQYEIEEERAVESSRTT